MAMNPLPPQAYTKDTLVKAYQWLQGQSESIREMATTPEVLVSLYLKAKLQGDGALERPSIQNFKNELKNLAGMMGEFEVVETPQFTHGPTALHTVPQTTEPPPFVPSPGIAMAQPSIQTISPPNSSSSTISTPSAESISPATSAHRGQLQGLDTRSWLMIQEVKNQLNLSNEQEALRMLISVGHQKIKNLMNP